MRKLFLIAFFLLLIIPLYAEAFILDYYSVIMNVDDERSMTIKEDFSLEYTVPSHGFYRDIQYRFRDGVTADVDILWTSEDVLEEDNGEYISVRFGDPDKRVIGGPYEYDMKYTYSLGADPYPDYDEIYYNIVSSGAWDTVIERLVFSVTLPHPVSRDRIWLTAGPYGSEMEIPFNLSEDGCTISGRYSGLPAGYSVTLRVEMEEGYFSEAVPRFNFRTLSFWLSLSLSVMVAALVLFVWWRWGRDEKLVFPVSYNPPEGLTPMDAAFIYKGAADNSAVSAMLIYWADKGIIEITDNGDDDFVFTRLSDIPEGAGDAEKRLFNAFFASSDSVDTKSLRILGFASKLQGVRKAESEYFTGERSLSSPSSVRLRKRVMLLLIIPVILHAFISTLTLPLFMSVFVLFPSLMAYLVLRSQAGAIERKMRGSGFRFSYIAAPSAFLLFIWFFIVSALSPYDLTYTRTVIETAVFLISLMVSMLASASIDRRSEYADKVLSSVLGYREFIEKVEKDRIEKLSKEDPQFFYHVLSYAMALDTEDEWVRAFSGMYVEPARWYHGDDVADIYILSSFSRRWNHAYSSVIAPQPRGGGARTTRGSSGFSGGGFSGGGGRSW